MVRIKQLYELAYRPWNFFLFLLSRASRVNFNARPVKLPTEQERKREESDEKDDGRMKDGKRSVTGPKMETHAQRGERLCGISIDWPDR